MGEDDGELSFPDAPRAALDSALNDLVDRARKVLETQGRLRDLLRADQAMLAEPDLPVMLRRIVDAAVDLMGADYGALGVIAPRGGLEEFIYVGMTPKQAKQIGHLPEGHGLLGALIDDPRPIRLEHLASDPRSIGFPPHHPPMDGFLGVPIRVHGEVFGNLYLSNERAVSFTADDEELAISLATTAGYAIHNARLYQQSRRRQQWVRDAGELVTSLLSEDLEDPVQFVARRMGALVGADEVDVAQREPSHEGTPDENAWSVSRVAGDGDHGERSSPMVSHAALQIAAASEITTPLTPASASVEEPLVVPRGGMVAVPIAGGDSHSTLIILSRRDDAPSFGPFERELLDDLARRASLALQLAEARADRQRLELVDDRSRIARDLHDRVIQQIFAAGLELQSVTAMIDAPAAATRISGIIDMLDASIAQIRSVVFALSSPPAGAHTSLRHRLLDLANEFSDLLPSTPAVSFRGAVDLLIKKDLAEDVVAVAREALTNVAKHAHAGSASLTVSVDDGSVVLEVVDDGDGMGESTRRSGLANLEYRANQRGGRFELESDASGTRLRWSAPLVPRRGRKT